MFSSEAHLYAMTMVKCTHAKEKKAPLLGKKHSCWLPFPEIKVIQMYGNSFQSNYSGSLTQWTLMGPLVLLAVITLSSQVLIAAEIRKAHKSQALVIHNCVYIQKSDGGWGVMTICVFYLWSTTHLKWRWATQYRTRFTAFKGKMESISTEIMKRSGLANTKQGIMGTEEGFPLEVTRRGVLCSKRSRCGTIKCNHVTLNTPFVATHNILFSIQCLHL